MVEICIDGTVNTLDWWSSTGAPIVLWSEGVESVTLQDGALQLQSQRDGEPAAGEDEDRSRGHLRVSRWDRMLPAQRRFLMGISKASGEWTGGFKDGKGVMRPAHAAEAHFSASSRFEGEQQSNPEELIGAALSGCFSMALTLALEKAGLKPQSVKTSADVHLVKGDDGFAIKTIDLTTDVKVEADEAKFQQVAADTKKGCPVSKALGGVTINLTARRS